MIFKHFSFRVTFYSIIVAVIGTLFLWSFSQEHLQVARFTFLALWILSLVILIRFINMNNRSLERFLDVLNGSDRFHGLKEKGGSFRNLNEAFTRVMDTLSTARFEKEEQFHFFRTAIEQVGVGLLAFNAEGKILLLNAGAKSLLGISFLNQMQDLYRLHPKFEDLVNWEDDKEEMLINLVVEGNLKKLSLRVNRFLLRGEKISMVSFQDIRSELEEGEVDAWQKLIRVITHEIMNSITPMKTLSSTLLKTFDEGGRACALENVDERKIENAHLGLSAIKKRSEGLAQFVNSYRSITRIPEPEIAEKEVNELLQEVRLLISEEVKERSVNLELLLLEEKTTLLVDEKLIIQVLINLLRNALNAVSDTEKPVITLGAQLQQKGNIVLFVADNGCGIDPQIREQIFVPFFTTRKDGSGIGLSFSQQVMRLHKGKIILSSDLGQGACFELVF